MDMSGNPNRHLATTLARKGLYILLIALAGCAGAPSWEERQQHADALANARQWHRIVVPSRPFALATYQPSVIGADESLTIYIEGDGFAWRTSTSASRDPTPLEPLGLKLALQHPHGNAAYLARPCMFAVGQTAGCNPAYWTGRRFSQEVVDSTNHAIDLLKTTFKADTLVLVGYSGGGAIASLVAASRDDVARLITVAGNLDPEAWARRHRITPLEGSLNPADVTGEIADLPQWHFIGGNDRIVPADVAKSFAAGFPDTRNAHLVTLDGFTHSCCWANVWEELMGDAEPVSRHHAEKR
jgi:pimeloyl-ACP methyl ester carboxylesterase